MHLKLLSGRLTKSTPSSVGYDIHSAEDRLLHPGDVTLIRTDIKTQMIDCFALILDRSGLVAKFGVSRRAGVIDPDYRDFWGVVVVNEGREGYQVRVGDRIAQCVILPLWDIPVYGADVVGVGRVGGFGSTGK